MCAYLVLVNDSYCVCHIDFFCTNSKKQEPVISTLFLSQVLEFFIL